MRRSIGTLFIAATVASHGAGQDDCRQPPPGAPQVSGTHRPTVSTASALASGPTPLTIHCNLPLEPTAAVPGLPGFRFEQFDRPFRSPNGHWILTATTDDPSTANDEVVLVNGVAMLKEGDPAPWDPANNVGSIDTRVQINDAGEWTFCTNTSPSTVNDDYVMKVTSGGAFLVAVQEGDLAPGSVGGEIYTGNLDSAVLTAGGVVGWRARTIGGFVSTFDDDRLDLGLLIVAQESVTIPNGQAGGATDAVDNFDFEDFWIDATGTNVLWQGDLLGSTLSDDVVVLNNVVVLQEGSIVPNSGFVESIDSNGIVGVHMDPSGTWYARGNNGISEVDWVVRNGVVVAAVGQPVIPGSSELWDDTDFSDCFFAHCGNASDDYVLGGVTNAASIANGVLVFNGTNIVCRENDPIDLDNDGVLDDDTFIAAFGNDDVLLTDDLYLYFTATIRNGAGVALGQGYFRADLSGLKGPISINEIFVDAVGSDNGLAFVEIAAPPGFDLSGYVLRSVEGTGGSCGAQNTSSVILPPNSLVFPDGLFLIADVDGSGQSQVKVATKHNGGVPDLIAEVDFENGPDTLQLIDTSSNIVDVIGYGAVTCATDVQGNAMLEGTPTLLPAPGMSLARFPHRTDTGDNGADFQAQTYPTPGAPPTTFGPGIPRLALETNIGPSLVTGVLEYYDGPPNGSVITLAAFDTGPAIPVFGATGSLLLGFPLITLVVLPLDGTGAVAVPFSYPVGSLGSFFVALQGIAIGQAGVAVFSTNITITNGSCACPFTSPTQFANSVAGYADNEMRWHIDVSGPLVCALIPLSPGLEVGVVYVAANGTETLLDAFSASLLPVSREGYQELNSGDMIEFRCFNSIPTASTDFSTGCSCYVGLLGRIKC